MTDLTEDAFEFAREWLEHEYPMICGGLIFNTEPNNSSTYAYAHRVLKIFHAMTGTGNDALIKALDAFAKTTFDFIRLQARFMKSGHYRSQSADILRNELYLNSEKMEGYYLDGLLLTYVFWPNHTRLLKFLETEFFSRLPTSPTSVLEIGVGHGLMAYLVLSHLEKARYLGLDISPSSLRYAQHLLQANRVDTRRFQFEQRDVVQQTPEAGKCNALLCCEVLEHVESPEKIVQSIRNSLITDGRAFVTTVANMEAEDHIYLFHDENHIRNLLIEHGLTIEKELVLPLRGMEDADPRPLNYAAVVRISV